MSIPRSAIVTGGTGFIGTHLTKRLAANGCEPVLLRRRLGGPGKTGGLGRILRADLADVGSVSRLLSLEKPDVLFHLAGTRGLKDRRGRFVACVEVNITTTVSLIEAAQRAGIPRIVLLGSAEEYGDQPGPLHEGLPTVSVSAYGVSKAAATRMALALHESSRCPVVVIRPFTVYGPGQPADMFVAEAISAAVLNSDFRMSLGRQKRDLVFIDDVISGLISAAGTTGIEGQVINLGSGTSHTLKHVAETIWRLSGATSRIVFGGRTASGDSTADTWADVTLARKVLGWEPRFELDQGLAETISWMRERQAKLERLCRAS